MRGRSTHESVMQRQTDGQTVWWRSSIQPVYPGETERFQKLKREKQHDKTKKREKDREQSEKKDVKTNSSTQARTFVEFTWWAVGLRRMEVGRLVLTAEDYSGTI